MKYLLLITIHLSLFATEVDNFTQRYQHIDDATSILDEKVTFFIGRAVEHSNWEYSCNEANLYRNLKRQFNLFGWSKFEIFAAIWPSIPKLYPAKVTIFEYFPLCGVKLPFTVAPIFNVAGQLVGGDKFSHFFNEGWNYFKEADLKGAGIEAAIKGGESDESGFWGVMTTGVYSYGDLVANYQGYRFWASIIKGDRPYVSCREGKWKVIRDFSWREYVDAGFDEAYNCSSFRNKEMQIGFIKRTRELEKMSGKKMSCPLSVDTCRKLSKKYGSLSRSLLHPLCDQNNKRATQGDYYVYR